MKKLLIDPRGGMAGDMFAAALISAGANNDLMMKAMWLAASKLGKAHIGTTLATDGSTRLVIDIEHDHSHLSGHESKHLIHSIFEELEMDHVYREFGLEALQILIDAEKQAHKENTFLTDHHHFHSHNHDHLHSHNHNHHHHHEHDENDAFLHEAQDILIDITGAAYGLQLLDIAPQADLLAPVSLGGGIIKFSHGEMSAPAPATKNIIQNNWIPSQLGPVDKELCTPTGASILAALNATRVIDYNIGEFESEGLSRGSKDLPINPLRLLIC
ncbi:MAG: DUF111 family protein [Marinilabiliaceae bacterium]|nr:DUF111 family protein [Marinilabiliaceae bacterium]